MSHGRYCLGGLIKELAQTISDHTDNDNDLRLFNGNFLGYFDATFVAVNVSHGEILLTLECEFDLLAQAPISNRKITSL